MNTNLNQTFLFTNYYPQTWHAHAYAWCSDDEDRISWWMLISTRRFKREEKGTRNGIPDHKNDKLLFTFSIYDIQMRL
jgi:hypothetical protein